MISVVLMAYGTPRTKEEKVRVPAESSVLVATLMLWPLRSALRNAGAVSAFAREYPCGSAHARRTR